FIVNWLKGEKPLLILHGPGGIGKSRLAVESILRVMADFAGSIFGVALDEEFDSDPATVTAEQLAATIARTVNAPKEVIQNPLQHLIPFLKARPKTLVFLDNGESVFNNDTVPWFARIVQETPNIRWLVTSRYHPGLAPLAEGYEVPPLLV